MVRQRRIFKAIRKNRLSKASKALLGTCTVLVIVGLCFAVTAFRDSPKEPFIGVAVFGDPVSIVYIDRTTKRTSLISLPATTIVDACAAYGTYPVSSLWRLGEIEKRGGSVFASSLSSALGIPIKYYIGPKVVPDKPGSAQEYLSQVFTMFAVPKIITRDLETNMPIATFLELTRAVGDSLSTSTILDLSQTYALSNTEINDGTRVNKINPDGSDLVFRQTHEVSSLREENIRVAVVNTTGVSGLGQKVARVLSHAGITVVDTGSEDKQFETCEVTSGKVVASSLTVRSIVSFLSCNLRTSEDTGKADVVLRLGKNEAQMY